MAMPATVPIGDNWTRWRGEHAAALRPVPLRALAAALGGREVVDLEPWGIAIDTVAADAAEECGAAWPHTPGTPVVVLLRAIGRLAYHHPDATTLLGEALLVMIEAAEASGKTNR